jgi:N-acetylneuraminic acid mutarotase
MIWSILVLDMKDIQKRSSIMGIYSKICTPPPIVRSIFILIIFLLASEFCLALGDEWVKKADMKSPRMCFNSVVVDGIIYSIGGATNLGVNVDNGMELYNIGKDFWELKAKMNERRCWYAANEFEGKIYVIGGSPDGANPFSSIEVYDPIANKWEFKKDLPIRNHTMASAVSGNKIYVIGGYFWHPVEANNGIAYKDVYAYDPTSDKWEKKADYPMPNSSPSACSYNGKIYCMGGSDVNGRPYSEVYMYDPDLDQWIPKTKLLTPRTGMSINVLGDKFYVTGGHSPQGTVSVIDVYDPIQDQWVDQIKMTEGRSWHGSAIIDNELYVMGGTHFYQGFGWPPQDILSLVEKYSMGNPKFSVNPQDKLTSTWGSIKSVR